MATGTKTGGKNFAMGNPGRPHGTKIIPKRIKDINRREIETIFNKYLHMNADDLKKTLLDKTTHSIDLIAIKIITEAIKKGDYTRFNFILDRMVGTVKAKIDISNSDGSLKDMIKVIIPSNGREKEIK